MKNIGSDFFPACRLAESVTEPFFSLNNLILQIIFASTNHSKKILKNELLWFCSQAAEPVEEPSADVSLDYFCLQSSALKIYSCSFNDKMSSD